MHGKWISLCIVFAVFWALAGIVGLSLFISIPLVFMSLALMAVPVGKHPMLGGGRHHNQLR